LSVNDASSDAEATLYLLEAERSAPEAIRYNSMVRELLRELLVRAGALD